MNNFQFETQHLDPRLIVSMHHIISEWFSVHSAGTIHELIKAFQFAKLGPFSDFDLNKPHHLFLANFLTHHALHTLNDSIGYTGFRLQVDNVRVNKVLLEDAKQTLDVGSCRMREYYLDLSNLWQSSDKDTLELLSQFWKEYQAYLSSDEAWEVLGIPSTKSEKDIKTRFRLLAQTHHPDKQGDAVQFAKIVQAKDLLLKQIKYRKAR